MSDGVTFSLPAVGSAAMSTTDQQALTVNQATAIIISAWLEHATALVQAGITESGTFTVSRQELGLAIDQVQAALRS
jgi:hypothetical protein